MTKLDLSGILVCAHCGAPLPPDESWMSSGTRCAACGVEVPVIRGIPRFVASDAYTASFGFEWNRHRQTQLDDATSRESEETFRAKTGLSPEAVAGRLVLDVGCGMGRFADVVSRWGGHVVGIDLSLAVEAAHANLGGRENVRILQADLFHLPFQPGTFDIVYSLGVLHHTPDCEKAFRQLVPFVRPGGRLCVWVYGAMGSWEPFSRLYRKATVRMPKRLLHALCRLAIPWYHVCRLPLIGGLLWTILPISRHPDPEWRVLDTFDWYSPRYQSLHAYPEVYGWFATEGFTDIRLLDFPVAVSGHRPSPGERP
ncbi:MAG TPA: methyltransferase domain-containing protein [Candidatus Acidoferrum sp.]|nr:methyltransferase domain-containing protein [Candidatus Acidoferrum sp.]